MYSQEEKRMPSFRIPEVGEFSKRPLHEREQNMPQLIQEEKGNPKSEN